jgi:DNA-binding FrmR family transcriptional regulator
MADLGDSKTDLVGRLKPFGGQVHGIRNMVETDGYCIEVVTQVNATRAALESVALLVLGDHTEHCVAEAIIAGDPGPRVREISETIERTVRG